MPHCSVCKEQLSGDNSIISPYRCKCGTWQIRWGDREYTLAEPEDEKKHLEIYKNNRA